MQSELAKHDDLLLALAKVVQSRREKLGFSQDEVAKRAGLHRTYISDIERGARNLSVRSLSRLAQALQVTPSALVHTAETLDMPSNGDSASDISESAG